MKTKGEGIVLDSSNINNIQKEIKEIYKKYHSIDILINNSGIKSDKLLINMNTYDWENVIKNNLNAVFYMCKSILPKMIRNKRGRIVTIGSIIGNTGNVGQTNYSASKSGLIGLNKSLALEVASYNITVNMISPGLIKTPMSNTLNKSQYNKYIKKIPMRRIGNVSDITNFAIFLVSKKSSYITGQNFHVNGGMYME